MMMFIHYSMSARYYQYWHDDDKKALFQLQDRALYPGPFVPAKPAGSFRLKTDWD